MDTEAVIRQYIPQVIHLSLATIANNRPWVCEVHFAYDDDLNLYFRSLPTTRHSQEIAQNPNVAGNIITQHFLNQTIRGVYFEGTAKLLDGVDGHHIAYQVINQRLGLNDAMLKPEGIQFYQILVSNWYVFDRYDPSTAGKHHLPWSRK